MTNKEKTKLGLIRLTQGKVAKQLRQILYRELSDSQVETIVVVLSCHLFVENGINQFIFKLLTFALPRKVTKKTNEKVEIEIAKNIRTFPFRRKLQLITPVLDKRQRNVLEDINTVRNDIIHAKKRTDKIFFDGNPIWQEKTIVNYFESCQGAYHELMDLCTVVDLTEVRYERWAKELKKRGIPLL